LARKLNIIQEAPLPWRAQHVRQLIIFPSSVISWVYIHRVSNIPENLLEYFSSRKSWKCTGNCKVSWKFSDNVQLYVVSVTDSWTFVYWVTSGDSVWQYLNQDW